MTPTRTIPELIQSTVDVIEFLHTVNREKTTIQEILNGTSKYKNNLKKETASIPREIKNKQTINSKTTDPKINNFMIICCRKSYFRVCSNSHIPDVKLRNISSTKKLTENITIIVRH